MHHRPDPPTGSCRGSWGQAWKVDDEIVRIGRTGSIDDPQDRGLVARLHSAARRRLGLAVFFVRRGGDDLLVGVDAPPG